MTKTNVPKPGSKESEDLVKLLRDRWPNTLLSDGVARGIVNTILIKLIEGEEKHFLGCAKWNDTTKACNCKREIAHTITQEDVGQDFIGCSQGRIITKIFGGINLGDVGRRFYYIPSVDLVKIESELEFRQRIEEENKVK